MLAAWPWPWSRLVAITLVVRKVNEEHVGPRGPMIQPRAYTHTYLIAHAAPWGLTEAGRVPGQRMRKRQWCSVAGRGRALHLPTSCGVATPLPYRKHGLKWDQFQEVVGRPCLPLCLVSVLAFTWNTWSASGFRISLYFLVLISNYFSFYFIIF